MPRHETLTVIETGSKRAKTTREGQALKKVSGVFTKLICQKPNLNERSSKMARTEKELPINNISYQFVGTEEDLIKFLKALTFEYLTANYPDTEYEMHKVNA